MQHYAATVAVSGRARRIVFDAADEADALRVCTACNAALVGLCEAPQALPEAYDVKTAQRLLGGVSQDTIYRDVLRGRLQRVPGTRRLLITRSSLEQRALIP